MNWSDWSKEAAALMGARNAEWRSAYQLEHAKYHWDVDSGLLEFATDQRRVVADICVVGTVSESDGSFLWGWANSQLPSRVTDALCSVREFGDRHDLALLTTSSMPGGKAEGLECAVVAGRIQEASGVFIDAAEDWIIFFTLFNFRQVAFEAGRKG